jgi:hypothetical protein
MHDNPHDDFSYRCRSCGELHADLPDFAFGAPLHYTQISPADRDAKAVLTTDTCSIAEEDFFVRGCLEIPVHGRPEPFTYGVWVSLSREHYERFLELYEEEDRICEGPWFAWLCNSIPGYPETLLLKTNVHLRPYPTRPFIELEPTDHPLAVEQRDGISMERLQAIVERHHHAKHAV